MTGLLTEGPVKRRLALFTLPILVSNILQQLYSAADAVIVGRIMAAVFMVSTQMLR